MLSWSQVLTYSKQGLGYPATFIEFEDSEIQDYLKDNCLRKFSMYFPDKWSGSIDTTNENNKISGKQNIYYFNDSEGREILSIDEFITDASDKYVMGHPIVGAYSYQGVPNFALDAFKANNARAFSDFNYTIKFFPPNMVRILPSYSGTATFEYSRVHAEDLSTIPIDLAEYFKDLCRASFLMWVGVTRSNYTGVNTPFGEIPINGSEIYSRGETQYNDLIQKFETSSAPFIIVDVG